MRFKIDENLSDQVKEYLVSLGHDAHTVRDELLNGKPDSDIAAAAKNEQRILLSLDSDFANILIYPPRDYYGIIFLRLERQDNHSVLKAIARPIQLLESNPIQGSLWVVTESEIRIRQ